MNDERTEASIVGRDAAPRAALGWGFYLALCAIGLTLALTWLNPSAAEGLGPGRALVFWAVHVLPAIALLAVTQIALGRLPRVARLPGVLQVVVSALVASVVFTPMALGLDALFDAAGSRDDAAAPLWLRAAAEFAHFAVPFVLIWGLINAPSLLRLEKAGPPDAPGDPPEPRREPADEADFWSRVPGRLGRELVALSAELHYLRVHTTKGEALILFPFGRAVEQLRAADGMQVHRSHWVALDRIDEVVTRDGRTFCNMIDGPSLPVSRSYRSELKAARRAGGSG